MADIKKLRDDLLGYEREKVGSYTETTERLNAVVDVINAMEDLEGFKNDTKTKGRIIEQYKSISTKMPEPKTSGLLTQINDAQRRTLVVGEVHLVIQPDDPKEESSSTPGSVKK